MSLSNIKSYFRTKLNTLGYKEHDDGFNSENIASSNLNSAYFIELGDISLESHSMSDLSLLATVNVKVFFKGYRTPKDTIDNVIVKGEAILKSFLNHSDRLSGNLKDVVLDNMFIEKLSDSNDNSMMLNIDLTTKVIMDVLN